MIKSFQTVILLLFIAVISVSFCQPYSAFGMQGEIERAPLRIGLLPDTQGSGTEVSIHPMEAVLKKFQQSDVDLVIAVGDLTNQGSSLEFDQWTSVAEPFRNAGMEFIPLIGNHERSYAKRVEWIERMQEYIPSDALHMQGAEFLNYYVIRENVLIIALKYYHLPIAFRWIKEVVNKHRDEVDHILIASHDGLIGAKYGQTREMIVEGTKGSDLLYNLEDEIRAFFAANDVIWVQGHEHMYQRSVIEAPAYFNVESWSPDDGNYRMPIYTQIITGNASYKGYEFRYGERELVQDIIQQKINTMENGSAALDVNASILLYDKERVDYHSYFASHGVTSNDATAKELEDPEWVLMDRFGRTINRCERIVYPNSIPAGTRTVLDLHASYRTQTCVANDGSRARILEGVNNTFNRMDTTPSRLSWRPGYSRAESKEDLMRLAYHYLFQDHRPWSPNLNRNPRLEPGEDPYSVEIPATTIDLKEHITLSWLPANGQTVSDILIVSGTQVHSGIYSGAWGEIKNMELDTGYENSQPDGTAKQPHKLPERATRRWNIEEAVADRYVLQFELAAGNDPERVIPGYFNGESWQPFTKPECIIEAPYENGMIAEDGLVNRNGACDGEPITGFDNQHGSRWWVVLDSDIEAALIAR